MNDNQPEWLFNESLHIGVDYSNKDLAADYDSQHEGFRDFEAEARKIAAALELPRDSILLDIGCGTGGLSTHLARTCKHLYAVDVSEAMIQILEGKLERQGLNNVTPIQSGFLTYQHRGEPPDAIVVNMTLHHLPDCWKQIALCRFNDMLKPGGRMFLADVVFDFDPRDYGTVITEWLDNMRNLAGPEIADEAVVHVRDEFSTWEWIVTGMLKRAGFQIDSDLEIMPQVRSYVCSKQ